jgi:hypothetical protein
VLGDAAQYQHALEQQQAAQEAQAAVLGNYKQNSCAAEHISDGLASLDPAVVDSIPSDVWEAAQLLGDKKGMRVIAVYKELAEQRCALSEAVCFGYAAQHHVAGRMLMCSCLQEPRIPTGHSAVMLACGLHNKLTTE